MTLTVFSAKGRHAQNDVVALPGEMMRQLMHAATANEPRTRDRAADEITDVVSSLTSQDAAVLAAILVTLAATEDDSSCREAQLHAIYEIDAAHPVPQGLLEPLHTLRAGAVGSETEYLDALLATT